jgi:hypothetical protein
MSCGCGIEYKRLALTHGHTANDDMTSTYQVWAGLLPVLRRLLLLTRKVSESHPAFRNRSETAELSRG